MVVKSLLLNVNVPLIAVPLTYALSTNNNGFDVTKLRKANSLFILNVSPGVKLLDPNAFPTPEDIPPYLNKVLFANLISPLPSIPSTTPAVN